MKYNVDIIYSNDYSGCSIVWSGIISGKNETELLENYCKIFVNPDYKHEKIIEKSEFCNGYQIYNNFWHRIDAYLTKRGDS